MAKLSSSHACLPFLLSSASVFLGSAQLDPELHPGLGLLQVRAQNKEVKDIIRQRAEAPENSTSSDWRLYRLADIVNGKGLGNESDFWSLPLTHSDRLSMYAKLWPQSIATEYLGLTKEVKDYKLFCEIVRKRGSSATSTLPGPQVAVVHLRLGDTADQDHCESMWENGSAYLQSDGRPFVKPRQYYESVISKLPANITEVVLVGSDFHQETRELGPIAQGKAHCSKVYFHRLESLFALHGYKVKTRWNLLPDDDFIYLSHAAMLVYGGGSFSRNAGYCVHRLHGSTLPGTKW